MGAYKRKWGDRKDGRKLRTMPAMSRISPYIMDSRISAQNLIADSMDITYTEAYIHRKRAEGLDNFGMMHVLLAAYIRAVSQLPYLNRFVAGQKVYARHNIEIVMTIKKEMSVAGEDTVIKIRFTAEATAEDVYRKMTAEIQQNREQSNQKSAFDSVAGLLNKVPGPILKLTVGLLRFLDYFGWLPNALERVSPFHGSLAITSLGSLGIPPVFHHLYNFGNIPMFLAYGAKQKRMVIHPDGTTSQKKFIDFTISTDERICDGYYFAYALRMMKNILKNPAMLDTPPEQVKQDIR